MPNHDFHDSFGGSVNRYKSYIIICTCTQINRITWRILLFFFIPDTTRRTLNRPVFSIYTEYHINAVFLMHIHVHVTALNCPMLSVYFIEQTLLWVLIS